MVALRLEAEEAPRSTRHIPTSSIMTSDITHRGCDHLKYHSHYIFIVMLVFRFTNKKAEGRSSLHTIWTYPTELGGMVTCFTM